MPDTYRHRGYLPHIDRPCGTQFLTWRLHDAFPPGAWERVLEETHAIGEHERATVRMQRAEALLDDCPGAAHCRDRRVAQAVQDALWFGHQRRYFLEAFVVMPNHVHVVLSLLPKQDLATVVRTIKSYSARAANLLLGREGRFWQVEYFDRLVLSDEQMRKTARYIEWNPVKAGLVAEPKAYRWSSAFPANAERLSDRV